MVTTRFHPSFTFNGTQFSENELLVFAKKIQSNGADYEQKIGAFIEQWLSESVEVFVNTSGSTGSPKRIALQKNQMIASALATGTYFNLSENTTSLLCLPANYIAGKMMLVRAMVLGWDLHAVAPEKEVLDQNSRAYDFAAMVPYQVFHSLHVIHKIKKLIIGGGAVSLELRSKLQEVSTQVFETYGMTETITHISVKRINGPEATATFSALPDVTFQQDERDCLVVNAPKISDLPIITNDVVALISATEFNWLGRYDNVINSGGVKLYPELIEAKLSKVIDRPFIIMGEKDDALGERVTLVFEAFNDQQFPNYAKAFDVLTSFERPKKVYTLSRFPYTETGKIKRAEVKNVLLSFTSG